MTENADINFKWPLKKISRGFPESNRTINGAIKEDLKILLLTSKGERLMDPNMGTNVSKIYGELFNNVNKSEMERRIRQEIVTVVKTYMPSVNIIDVKLRDYEDDSTIPFNQISISVVYNSNNSQDTLNLRVSGT